ncbi:hypothetical protein PAXRUDRAFT_15376 [Paxillus rubicundulus Ve08.2h10]|uniref:Uncharacterized protein n=1 Tax=Paxillus rubicundulus Ve08.2h10 TaxID=930991 RepID=A0A0D0CEM4_9AGAM|nr:hypothetical protein PAXRUDRAFT_15376 [Paxillus rubicundulus Ve08.2h10]
MKAQKEAEHQRAEEEVRQKAEDEAKHKVEVEARRRVEVDAKAHAEEVVWVQCDRPGDVQSLWWRKQEEAMLPQARKKKAQMKSPVADEEEEDMEDSKAEENHDVLGALTEVLSVVVGEMWNMDADKRRVAAESHVPMERMLGTLEEIRGCLDPEFTPEEGLEEDFEEEEVVEAAEEKEALKGWSKEEAEVDKSV